MGTERLHGERVILRKYVVEDAERLYELFGKDSLTDRYTGWNPYKTREMAQATVEDFISQYEKEHFYGWAIEADGQLIGTIGAYDYDDKMRSIEIGYSIGREYWGKGYAKEAAGYVVYYLMQHEGIEEIRAWCLEKNVASVKICESLGMEVVGREEKIIDGHTYTQLNFATTTEN